MLKIAVLAGNADPEVLIHGASSLTAGGTLDASATSDLTIRTTAQPNLLSKVIDPTIDGAVAVTVFDSTAVLSISDSASVSSTGAASLTAGSTLTAITFGDATGDDAGAGVAVSVIYGDTTASIQNATVNGSSVTLASSSNRTITTVANSSAGGSSGNGGKNERLDRRQHLYRRR